MPSLRTSVTDKKLHIELILEAKAGCRGAPSSRSGQGLQKQQAGRVLPLTPGVTFKSSQNNKGSLWKLADPLSFVSLAMQTLSDRNPLIYSIIL